MLSGTRNRPPVWCQPAPSQIKTAWASGDLSADHLQMMAHRLGIDLRHDDRRTDGAIWADCTEDISRVVPVIAHHQRARADRSPDIGVGSLLTDPGLVLEPDLDRPAEGAGRQGIGQQAGEVFFKSLFRLGNLLGMTRTRLKPGQSELVQPPADRALVHFDGKPSSHLGLQIHASPAHNLVLGRIGSRTTSALNSTICAGLKAGARPGLRRDFKPSIPAAL